MNKYYIFLVKDNLQKDVIRIPLKYTSRISYEVSESTELDETEIKDQFYGVVQNFFRLYENFVLINTSFFVSHGHLISVYDIIKQKWIMHFNFEKKIIKVFRNQKDLFLYNLCVLFEDQTFKLIDSDDISVPDLWKL